MAVLKGAALGFFGFILFLAVIIFMVANTVNGTVLSPSFITTEINKIEVGPRIVDFVSEDLDDDDSFPPAARDALFSAIIDTEPVIKEALNAGINSIADYLRGETDDPALAGVLANTFFNAGFLQTVLAEVDVATLASAVIEEAIPGDYAAAILNAITENEERIKSQLAAASQPVFDYLLSRTATIDLLGILRETVLTSDFVLTLLDGLDIASISSAFLSDELVAGIPSGMEYLSDSLDEAVAALAPAIKSAVAEASDQLLDYITGASQTVQVEVSLAPVLDDLEDTMRQAFLAAVPAQWSLLPQSQQDQLLDDFIAQARGLIPASFTIDETMIGSDLPDQISDGLAEAETALSEARSTIAEEIANLETGMDEPRTYIGWFLSGYMALIALLAVVILAIIGLHREVKGATRQLGTTALVCGIVGAVAVFVGNNYFVAQMSALDIPLAMADLPEILFNDLLAPFGTISYGLIGGGLVLIAVSLIYPRLRARDTAEGAPPSGVAPSPPSVPAPAEEPEPSTEGGDEEPPPSP